MKLLLASQSPRRKEILKELGFHFNIVSIDCEETFPRYISPYLIAGYLSYKKSKAYGFLNPDEILLTADTLVTLDNEILGKPKDEKQAFTMLKNLSEKKHQVHTGVTIRAKDRFFTKIDTAEVFFDKISDEEIYHYIENYNPLDKAAGYGIQDWIGMAKIKKINGNYYTIMGLCSHLVYEELSKIYFK